MKKVVFAVVLATAIFAGLVAAVFAGCGKQAKPAFAIDPVVNGDTVDEKVLIEAYRSGEWDGSFISNDAHCASVESGELWIDCRKAWNGIVDAVPSESQIDLRVLEGTADGTWLEDGSAGEIRLDKKGETTKRIVIPFRSFYAEKLARSLVVRSDDTVLVYNLDGVVLRRIDAVTDMAVVRGECFIATWENDNYIVSSDGKVSSVTADGIVRCQGQQSTVKVIKNDGDVDGDAVNAILAYENGWDGEFEVANNGRFRAIDHYGNVVIDNQMRGNVHLGYGYALDDGTNVAYGDDSIYVVDGGKLTQYSSANRGAGKSYEIPTNKGAEFEWIDSECCHVLLYKEDGKMDFVRVNFMDESVEMLAEDIVDANTAYDSIYFMGADGKVYMRLWASETEARFYCEGAMAISAHTDEGEGAILDGDGWLNYGQSARVYSPYSPEYK